jgi:hypothetical protein
MPEKEFSMEFIYEGDEYLCFVRPFVASHRTLYRVILERDKDGDRQEIVLKPSNSDLEEWEYDREDGAAGREQNQGLLEQIGQRVNECLGRISGKHVTTTHD